MFDPLMNLATNLIHVRATENGICSEAKLVSFRLLFFFVLIATQK